MKILLRSALLILLLSILIPGSVVQAVPPTAQTFYGSVTIDGSPAPDGTSITAEMNGRTAGSDTTSSGSYSLIIQTIEGDQAGDTITFFINGEDVGSTTLNPGGVTQRNLSYTTPPPPPDQVQLTIRVNGQGTTSPSPGTRNYDEGKQVTVKAIPADNWVFAGWTGDVANPSAEQTYIIMDEDKTITANFVSETEPPVISNINVTDITRTSVVINWTTNEPATSQVDYWASPGTLTPLDEELVTEHSVLIEGLNPATTYTFKVMSADAAGNLSVSDESTFETDFIEATFIFSDWEFTITETAPGKQVVIEFTIENTGDVEGTHEIPVMINGSAETTESITLASGASQEVSITISKTATGTYRMEVEGITISFEVKDLVAPPADGAADDGLDTTLLIGIIGGCLLLIILIVLIALKIKSDRELSRAAYELAEEKRLSRQAEERRAAAERLSKEAEAKKPEEKSDIATAETKKGKAKKTRKKRSKPKGEGIAIEPEPEPTTAEGDIVTKLDGGILTVTALAAEKLKEALESQTKDPDISIRLIPTPSPFGDSVQFEMTLDKQKPDDITITTQGTNILLISSEHTKALLGKVINCQQTPQGTRFTIS